MNRLEFITKVRHELGLKDDQRLNPREANIVAHYAEQIEKDRMHPTFAFERAMGDIKGRNYDSKKA